MLNNNSTIPYEFTNVNSEILIVLFSCQDNFAAYANNSALYPSSPVQDNGLLKSSASANSLISALYASLYRSKKKYLGFFNIVLSFVAICTFVILSLPAETTPLSPNTSTRWSYPYTALRLLSITAIAPLSNVRVITAVSTSSYFWNIGSIKLAAFTQTSVTSLPARYRTISKS